MKKFLLLITLFISVSVSSFATIDSTYIYDRWYAVDTLQCSKVGPGMEYLAVKFTAREGNLVFRTFVIKTDTDNPNLKFQCELANDSVIGVETVRHHAQSRTAPGKYYLAGTNGDFYSTGTPVGIPSGGMMQGGQCGKMSTGSLHFAISGERTPWVSYIRQSQTLSINGGAEIAINRVNLEVRANELVLFNTLNGGYTHTAAGVKEILLKVVDGQKWSANAPVECEVVGEASVAGNMQIKEGHVVIAADGSSMSVIDGMKTGDKVTIKINQTLTTADNATPDVMGTIGGNTILLKNGEVCPQGDMARHPRTMLGYTKDKKQIIQLVLDGRSSISSGSIYLEQADVLKYFGADWAMNIDGGGSSTMFIHNLGVMNNPSDGKERPVSNGMYLVLYAPEDNEIASIEFKDWALNSPQHVIYKPVIYGYNKYGMLINNDVQGFELSCPAELGRIENGTTLIASGTGTHLLTATLDGKTATIPVTVKIGAEVSMRMNKILLDTKREYPVDVQSKINEDIYPISADALKWTVDDPTIVEVNPETGVLKGLKDGVTTVHGALGDFVGDVEVTVEMPTEKVMPIDIKKDVTLWKVVSSGTKELNAAVSENGFDLNFKGSSSRNPYIKMSRELNVFSLPDVLRFRINPGDVEVKSLMVSVTPGEGLTQNIEIATNLKKNEMNTYELDLSTICDTKDLIYYPIKINSIYFKLGKMKSGQAYEIKFPGFEAIYNAYPAGVESVVADDDTFTIVPNPVEQGEVFTLNVNTDENVEVSVFDAAGRLVNKVETAVNNGKVQMTTEGLSAGIYFVTVNGQSAKLIVK